MDISELPDALSRLAQHLEQTDDDPFTLRSRDAVLLAMKLLAERMTPEEAIRAMGGTPADLPPTIRPLLYPVPPETRGAFGRLLEASVADMARRLEDEHDRRLGDLKVGQRLAVSVDFLPLGGRTVAHESFAVSGPMFMVLNPGQDPPLGQTWTIYGPMTEALREAVDGRDKCIVCAGTAGSHKPDCKWVRVHGGPTERNPTRCTVCGGIPPAHKFDCRVRPGGQVSLPVDYRQQPDRPHDRVVEVPRAPRTVYVKPPKCLRCAAHGLGHTSPEQVALAVKALGPHTCEEGTDRTDE